MNRVFDIPEAQIIEEVDNAFRNMLRPPLAYLRALREKSRASLSAHQRAQTTADLVTGPSQTEKSE